MLRSPGHYSDILRAIGRLLDEREALLGPEAGDPSGEGRKLAYGSTQIRDVEIIEYEAFMAVSWRTGDGSVGQQAYTELNLADLRRQARSLRGETAGHAVGRRERLWRTLGQELDAEQMNVSGIFEREDDLLVTGVAGGRYVNNPYRVHDLRVSSRQRRLFRTMQPVQQPASSPGRGSWWRPWARRAIGSTVT